MKPIQQEMQQIRSTKHENQQKHQQHIITKHTKHWKFIVANGILKLM
jgi:hypothetical protein